MRLSQVASRSALRGSATASRRARSASVTASSSNGVRMKNSACQPTQTTQA